MADTAQLQSIALDAIDCDIPNHRLLEDADRIAELARSIEAHGLQQPVRVYEKPDGRYILGFGFRRLAAHRQLERDTIPAFVLPPADDNAIRAAQAIENLHRQDLHPLEEAEACAAIQRYGILRDTDAEEAADIAAQIGRPKRWVEGRLALLRLSPRVRELLLANDIYLGHAQLIARLVSHDKQEEIAGRVAASHFEVHGGETYDYPARAIHECRRLVEAEQRNLADVTWRPDLEFAGQIACNKCPNNSANTMGLFDDGKTAKPQCLDADCFKAKTRAANNAVRKAVNTLNKSDGKPTKKNAEKAIAEREVEFIQPQAVARAAKQAVAAKQPTAAERHGRRESDAERQARAAYDDALDSWTLDRDLASAQALRADPYKRAIFLLVTCFPEYLRLPYYQELTTEADTKNWSVVREALDLIGHTGTVRPLEALDKVVHLITPPDPAAPDIPSWEVQRRNEWPLVDAIADEHPDYVIDELAEVLGLDLAPKPTLEQIQNPDQEAGAVENQ